ncbi:hypothetical protein [Bradyrhizobium canariense]|nr:hypothetical protein [Bradyrhizobium canariense]
MYAVYFQVLISMVLTPCLSAILPCLIFGSTGAAAAGGGLFQVHAETFC